MKLSLIISVAINILFSKKVRTFFSVALCFLSLFMFTLPLVGVSQDLLDVKIDALLKNNVKLSYIESNSKRVDPYYDFAISEFSDKQKEGIILEIFMFIQEHIYMMGLIEKLVLYTHTKTFC